MQTHINAEADSDVNNNWTLKANATDFILITVGWMLDQEV